MLNAPLRFICDGCCYFWSLGGGGHPRFLLFDVDE